MVNLRIFVHHNELCDLTVAWLQEVCHKIAPTTTIHGDDAWEDIYSGMQEISGADDNRVFHLDCILF